MGGRHRHAALPHGRGDLGRAPGCVRPRRGRRWCRRDQPRLQPLRQHDDPDARDGPAPASRGRGSGCFEHAGVPAVRVRARSERRPRRAPAGVHPEPRLQRASAVLGGEARRDPEGDEERERQRRQPHHRLHAPAQQRTPGRDHAADRRDRRRRRRSGVGQVDIRKRMKP